MKNMTAKSDDKELQTLQFISEFVSKFNYPPSVREICANVGFRSTASAQYYLNKLVENGKIRRNTGKNRTLEIIAPEFSRTANEDNGMRRVPMLGNIAAGQPLFAGVNSDEYIDISPEYFNTSGELFMLTVKGTSMINVGILDGDTVLIRKQPTAYNGQIIAAMIDNNEVTLKRFYKESDCVRLKPENDNMDDIIVDPSHDFAILGIAVGLMRNNIR